MVLSGQFIPALCSAPFENVSSAFVFHSFSETMLF
jgi:hypothetical protein